MEIVKKSGKWRKFGQKSPKTGWK